MLRGAGMALTGDPGLARGPPARVGGRPGDGSTTSRSPCSPRSWPRPACCTATRRRAEQVLARGIAFLPRGSEARHAARACTGPSTCSSPTVPPTGALDRARAIAGGGAARPSPPGVVGDGGHRPGRPGSGGGGRGRAGLRRGEPGRAQRRSRPRCGPGPRCSWPPADAEEARVHAEEAASGPPMHFPAQAAAAAVVRWAVLDGAPAVEVGRPVSAFPLLRPLTAEADGLDALLAGDPGTAVEMFRRSIAEGGMLRNQRRNRWALGEALRRDGRTAEAQHVLEDLAAEAGRGRPPPAAGAGPGHPATDGCVGRQPHRPSPQRSDRAGGRGAPPRRRRPQHPRDRGPAPRGPLDGRHPGPQRPPEAGRPHPAGGGGGARRPGRRRDPGGRAEAGEG